MTAAINMAEAEQFIALVKAGLPQTEAARKLGRSQTGMIDAAKRLGVIAGRLPCPNDPSGVPYEQILALHKSGLSNAAISVKVGLRPLTVRDKLRRAKAEEAALLNRKTLPAKPDANPPSSSKMPLRESTLPLEAGSDTTWSALGMDVDWKRAREMTAHLRPH